MVDLALLQEKIRERNATQLELHAALENLAGAKADAEYAENALLAVEGATPALLASLGVELRKPRKRGVAPAKWKHPDDDSLTWSGKGRRPKWAEYVKLVAI